MKKENGRLKRVLKELEKEVGSKNKRIEEYENSERKAAEIGQNIHILRNEFLKYKEHSERRYAINENKCLIIKERYESHLAAIIAEDC